MARSFSLDFPHNLGAETARQRVARRLDVLKNQFGDKIGSSEVNWAGNDAQIRVSALAQTATGEVRVTDDNVRINAHLPLLLSPLSGKIESFLQGVASEVLAAR